MNDAIAERLNRLEWANKKLTAAVAVLILGVMVAVGVGAARDDPRSIDAERLTLRDKGGKVRAEFIADRAGPNLILFDAEGSERFRLWAADDGTSLLNLATTTKDGGPGRAITLRSAADGWSTVSFADGTKQVRLVLGLGYDGEPRLRMSTKDGKARVTLGSDMSGRVDCILHDASGSERVVIRSAPDGSPSIKLYDREEKRVFHAP